MHFASQILHTTYKRKVWKDLAPTNCFNFNRQLAGEMAGQLSSLAPIPEGPCLIASFHITAHNCLQLLFQRSNALFWPLRAPYMYLYYRQNTCTNKITKSLKLKKQQNKTNKTQGWLDSLQIPMQPLSLLIL